MKTNEKNKLDNFNEFELKNLEKVVGGDIVITISGVGDGVKGNTDLKLSGGCDCGCGSCGC